ncbi:hypothetical protein [Pelagicoccus albus]|uniref:Heavy-metal resistance n=1 Tax=Pelagicoccus albus TaxID=415222 RepID=A0A7X1E970_9BACT|nr:hypothetical protein [Pelagicoccus albus]MBC2607114.1 hypothetical protein [Pelagicoccus albus]
MSGAIAHFSYYGAYAPQPFHSGSRLELDWMRRELDLSDAQYARIRQLHEERESDIRALSKRVRELENSLREMEAKRVAEGYVDYMAIRNYVLAKRDVDEACAESTKELIASVGGVMTLDQRRRYLSLLQTN